MPGPKREGAKARVKRVHSGLTITCTRKSAAVLLLSTEPFARGREGARALLEGMLRRGCCYDLARGTTARGRDGASDGLELAPRAAIREERVRYHGSKLFGDGAGGLGGHFGRQWIGGGFFVPEDA